MYNQIKNLTKKAGRELIELALTLFYCLLDNDTPVAVKSMILGDLAYLICPFDLIPDLTPGIGFTDDLTVLLGTIALIPKSIKTAHRKKASYTAAKWFAASTTHTNKC